jgi:hypothetical protein
MTLPPSLSPSVSHRGREGEGEERRSEDMVRGSGEGRNSRAEYEEIEEPLPGDLPPTEMHRLTTPASPTISTSSSIISIMGS